MTTEQFREQCEDVAAKLGLEVTFYEDTDAVDQFVDDGTLHVQNGELRACFDVSNGQDDKASVQNEKTESVMNELGLPVTSRVLVEEDDEEEDDDEDDWWGGDDDVSPVEEDDENDE
jgi:hypothetical protein